MPDKIIPPMAPNNTASMGTFTPRPSNKGLRNASLILTMIA